MYARYHSQSRYTNAATSCSDNCVNAVATLCRFIYYYFFIIKNEKIRVTLCENAAGALYIVNKMCVDGLRNVEG